MNRSALSTTCLAMLVALIAGASSSQGALLAHVTTTEGSITVELQYEKAPMAVANFITLAEGTRPHIDASTGAISNAPYYIGESFFRVIDNGTVFRIAQTGSGTGTNSGGPGYTFRDEFDPTLRHVPYVLSMANSGPNSNGSQIFFVGNSTPSSLNDVHTIFGLVTDPPSRAVIDAIHAAGNNGSSITGVSFERTDANAIAFDEMAQGLPSVVSVSGSLSASAGGPVDFTPATPFSAGQLVSVSRSQDLVTWSSGDGFLVGDDNAPLSAGEIDTATSAKAFYRLALADHPGSLTRVSLANRTLVVNIPSSTDIFTYVFDGTGDGGICIYSFNGVEDPPATITEVTYTPSAYGASLLIKSTNLRHFLFKIGFDAENATDLTGRSSASYWNGSWVSRGSGTVTLTK